MNTSIRKGRSIFYGDNSFVHGISRSGYFNKRESEELASYGLTLEGLYSGKLLAENNEEACFIKAIHSQEVSDNYLVNLWRKYLDALAKSRRHYGFAKSYGRTHIVEENDLSIV